MAETRKLGAILVADVVGYSWFASADEEHTLGRVRALCCDPIESRPGVTPRAAIATVGA